MRATEPHVRRNNALGRDLNIVIPSPTTSPIPTFFPTWGKIAITSAPHPPTTSPSKPPSKEPTGGPTKIPTKSPTKSPTKAPTEGPTEESSNKPTSSPIGSPTGSPTYAPVGRYQPKIYREERDENGDGTNQITTVTCEDSFEDIEGITSDLNVEIEDPPLKDVRVEFDYEMFVKNGKDKYKALEEMDYLLFQGAMSSASDWISSDLKISPNVTCDELLVNALDGEEEAVRLRFLVERNFESILGWKNEPDDVFVEGGECQSNSNVIDATCYPVHGKMTAQVPDNTDAKFTPLELENQVLTMIADQIKDDRYQTEHVPAIEFLGRTPDEFRSDYKKDGKEDGVHDGQRDLSVLARALIAGSAVALILFVTVTVIRRSRRETRFEKIRNDAIRIGSMASGPAHSPCSHEIVTEIAPDKIECISQDSPPIEEKKGLSLGDMLNDINVGERERGHGVVKIAGGNSISGASVETEDFGHEPLVRR